MLKQFSWPVDILVCILAVSALLIISTLAIAASGKGAEDWDRLTQHKLNMTVWTGDGKRSSWEELTYVAARRQFVLIGENHDNADHHRLQARLITALVEQGRKPAIVFEMISTSQQIALNTYLARPDRSAEGMGSAVNWEGSGWPAWASYTPIAEAGLASELPFIAGGLDRTEIMALARSKPGVIDPTSSSRFGLEFKFPKALFEDLLKELEVSHCNLMPKEALMPMVTVQRARDGAMSRALLSTGSQGAVLIAGKGHVRKDRAVPYVMRLLESGINADAILSIGLVGVKPNAAVFNDYLNGGNSFPFDYVVFTDRAKPVDHCKKLRKHLSKRQDPHTTREQQ